MHPLDGRIFITNKIGDIMNNEQKIFLDEPGQLLDGLFSEICEKDGFLQVRFELIENVVLEYPLDSREAIKLREKLTDEVRGWRVIVFRHDDPNEPLRVAIKTQRRI